MSPFKESLLLPAPDNAARGQVRISSGEPHHNCFSSSLRENRDLQQPSSEPQDEPPARQAALGTQWNRGTCGS